MKGDPPRGQVILRIDDERGHHIVRKHQAGWQYTIERHPTRPENYDYFMPQYYLPLDEDEVANLFEHEGKEFRR